MRRRTVVGAVIAALLAAAPLGAQDAPKITTTEAQLLATFNAPGQEDPFWVLTLQHFSLWKYGSNFFFLDVADQPGLDFFNEQPGLYLEYAPVVSLGALGVLPAGGVGPLRDVGVTAQINAGAGTVEQEIFAIDRVFLEGVELAWSVPGFAVFNTQLLARQELNFDSSWQLTWVYALPFSVGAADGVVTGFLDAWQRSPRDGRDDYLVVLAQPQLLFSLGTQAPGSSFLQVGVELQPSHKFPGDFVGDDWNLAVSPMVRWVF